MNKKDTFSAVKGINVFISKRVTLAQQLYNSVGNSSTVVDINGLINFIRKAFMEVVNTSSVLQEKVTQFGWVTVAEAFGVDFSPIYDCCEAFGGEDVIDHYFQLNH